MKKNEPGGLVDLLIPAAIIGGAVWFLTKKKAKPLVMNLVPYGQMVKIYGTKDELNALGEAGPGEYGWGRIGLPVLPLSSRRWIVISDPSGNVVEKFFTRGEPSIELGEGYSIARLILRAEEAPQIVQPVIQGILQKLGFAKPTTEA